jgi:hypothetical protein
MNDVSGSERNGWYRPASDVVRLRHRHDVPYSRIQAAKHLDIQPLVVPLALQHSYRMMFYSVRSDGIVFSHARGCISKY